MWVWRHNSKWINDLQLRVLVYINFAGYFSKSMKSDEPSSTFFNSEMSYAWILCLSFWSLVTGKMKFTCFDPPLSCIQLLSIHCGNYVCLYSTSKLLDIKTSMGASVLRVIHARITVLETKGSYTELKKRYFFQGLLVIGQGQTDSN